MNQQPHIAKTDACRPCILSLFQPTQQVRHMPGLLMVASDRLAAGSRRATELPASWPLGSSSHARVITSSSWSLERSTEDGDEVAEANSGELRHTAQHRSPAWQEMVPCPQFAQAGGFCALPADRMSPS